VTDRTPGPEPTEPHGTQAAIRRHERHDGGKLCEECRVERNRLAKLYYHQRKAKKLE